jgi:hypothetical protein
MVCTLCLADIQQGEDVTRVDDKLRHKSCSEEFETMVDELEKIYVDTCPTDI